MELWIRISTGILNELYGYKSLITFMNYYKEYGCTEIFSNCKWIFTQWQYQGRTTTYCAYQKHVMHLRDGVNYN
jgi:hypothetical protein